MINLNSLSQRFLEPEFVNNDHWRQNSEFRQLLLSLPGVMGESIPKVSLISLGLLWCKGDNQQQSEVLFGILSDNEKSQIVTCDDR